MGSQKVTARFRFGGTKKLHVGFDHGRSAAGGGSVMNMNQRINVTGSRTVQVLSASSELFPLVKTGGLADVTGALPKNLDEAGIRTRSLLPAYEGLLERCTDIEAVAVVELFGEQATILACRKDHLDILLLDHPALYHRRGGPYVDENSIDHGDNWKRFAALSLATAKIAQGCIPGWIPDAVHLHDWQTALAATYMRAMNIDTPIILTIHNLAFQGQFPVGIFPFLGLPERFAGVECLEYFGDICYLKGGVVCSDFVTTVSPTYAREILTDDLGMGMQGVLGNRRDVLRGILNGIDQEFWNPSSDPLIPVRYDSRTISRRKVNRDKLEDRFHLEKTKGAILSVVSRLTWQKGIDLITPLIPGIVDRGAKLIVYGQGDPAIIHPLMEESWRYPGRVVVNIGYNETDAHLLHAGSDMVLQPSRFEPCGLTQLYALKYGAIPIVARTGGLAETIIDANEAAMAARVATGFQFQSGSVEDFYHAIDRALIAFEQPSFWKRLQNQAMKADFSWQRSAEHYARLYQELLQGKQ